jgi:hypothetical protein
MGSSSQILGRVRSPGAALRGAFLSLSEQPVPTHLGESPLAPSVALLSLRGQVALSSFLLLACPSHALSLLLG